jgi:hypothetical protein
MATYLATVLADSPVAYYRLGEASGTSAADSSGNTSTATISGAGITYSQAGAINGDANTALLFDGAAGKITTPSGVNIVGWGAITVEAWVKLTSNSFGNKATIWATGTTPTNSGDGMKFWIGNNGTNGGFAVGVTGNQWAQAIFSQTFTAGVWYHVAGVWNGSVVKVYVNGVLNGSTGSLSGSLDDTGFHPAIGQDPQAGSDYFPGTLDEPALYSHGLSAARLSTHYATAVAQLAPTQPQPSFITNAPGNVLLLINDVWYPTIRQESVHIDRTASDPIPTFTLDIQDDPSHIPLSELMEVVFIDAGQIPNPTHNLLSNPAMNPYTTKWTYTSRAGVTPSQNTGGGLILAFANAAIATNAVLQQSTQSGDVSPGQSYMASIQVQGGATPTNIKAVLQVNLYDGFGALASTVSNFGALPVSTTLTQYQLSFTVPPGVATAQMQLSYQTTSATNSGTITFTQAQLEPMCFTGGNYQLSYPTPWAASGQLNCFVLPDGTTVRQLRLFGGYITKAIAGEHVGLNRRWNVTVSGYAWLLQKQLLNDSWTAQNDSVILSGIVTKYFAGVFSTAQVATGAQYSNTLAYAYNGTARDAFDAVAANSNFIYYIDAYRTIWYQPPGYATLAFALSDSPDELTSFEYYAYSRDFDATQLANITYVTGATGVAWLEYDAQSIATYAIKTGGSGMYWRAVSDSAIASNAAAQSRAIGETTQFNYARPIVHLSTNQFMIPGYTVLFTSATDGYSLAVFLVQKATLILYGFKSLFQAVYECQCDLGAFNPDLTNVLGKVLRRQNAATNTAGPAYYGPIPAVTAPIGVMATEQMGFRDTVQVTVTSTATIAGIPTTQYGGAAATYGNSLVGYG